MGDLIKIKEGQSSKADQMADQVAQRGKKTAQGGSRKITDKFIRVNKIREERSRSEPRNEFPVRDIEQIRLRSAITNNRKLKSNLAMS